MHLKVKAKRIAFVGSVGIPNRYGGFEAFLEYTTPLMVEHVDSVVVTCVRSVYPDGEPLYKGVERVFVDLPANGWMSVFHDLLAFFSVFGRADKIVMLGISGGIWFPIFRMMCAAFGKTLIVNIDGIEWKRNKFSPTKKLVLWTMNFFSQMFSHKIIIDNQGLNSIFPGKTLCISYAGDHVLHPGVNKQSHHALTVCRIEPENNVEMMIEGVLSSKEHRYTVIGNWDYSEYGRSLREKYRHNARLNLLDPIYDPEALAEHREMCTTYIHGHSVGGTNPSLVEMIFYDCDIYCLDVIYHHFTIGHHAKYFRTPSDLAELLDGQATTIAKSRKELRTKYTREAIAKSYLDALFD